MHAYQHQGHTHSDHDHGHGEGAHTHAGEQGSVPPRPPVALRDGHLARIAYFDCFAGASGDMLLGALVDAGLSVDALGEELAKLELDGYQLVAERIRQHGLTGTTCVE